MKRQANRASCLLAMAVALLLGGCEREETVVRDSVKPIRIFTVSEPLLSGGEEFTGRAQASQSANLSFRVAGRLLELPVREGDSVAPGQLVAQLDQRDFESRLEDIQGQLDNGLAVLQSMQSGARPEDVKRARAVVSARQSEMEEAQAVFERHKTLLDEGVVSRQEYDRVKVRRDGAAASLESARQELAIAENGARPEEIAAQQGQIRSLQARRQEARNRVDDARLVAPFGGIVARIDVSGFEDVQANQPIMSLQNLERIDVVIDVPEQDMARGRNRQRGLEQDRVVAEVSFPAVGPTWYPVHLKEYQTEADSQTQTFRVVLQMTQPAGLPVRPGMNAVVRGQAASRSDGERCFVPLNAVFDHPSEGKSVWLIDPAAMRVAVHGITTGRIVDDQVEVLEGLGAGDLIAASAVNLLREGMQVEPMKDPGDL